MQPGIECHNLAAAAADDDDDDDDVDDDGDDVVNCYCEWSVFKTQMRTMNNWCIFFTALMYAVHYRCL